MRGCVLGALHNFRMNTYHVTEDSMMMCDVVYIDALRMKERRTPLSRVARFESQDKTDLTASHCIGFHFLYASW